MKAFIGFSALCLLGLILTTAFYSDRWVGTASIEQDAIRDDEVPSLELDEATNEQSRDRVLASDFVGGPESILDSSVGHAGFNDLQDDEHPIRAQHRVLEDAVLEYSSFEEFFRKNKAQADRTKAAINAAEWMGVLCEQAIESAELDDDVFFHIRIHPYRMYFFMRLIDFCLGSQDNWDEVTTQIGQTSFAPNREFDTAGSYWFGFMMQFGRTQTIQELARAIQRTDSLAEMITAMRMLGSVGYLFSDEVGLGVPRGAYSSQEFVPAYEVSMLYFCQYSGGCGRYHPFTMDFCIRNACDEQVSDYVSAVHRSTPVYRKELLAVHYQVLLRLRREGVDGLNINPDYEDSFGLVRPN